MNERLKDEGSKKRFLFGASAHILDLFPSDWLLHGSDFPIPIDGWTRLPFIDHDVNVMQKGS